MSDRLKDTSILITGAAGGIGSAIAQGCAREGAVLTLTDIDSEGLNRVRDELSVPEDRVITVVTDATDDAQLKRAVNKAVDTFGSLGVTFSNAGIPCMATIDQITPELFQRVMTVNVYSMIATGRATAAAMRTQSTGGKIINTCSVSGKTALAGDNLYCASKFAVRSLTSGMAKELAPDITVNAMCPGVIDTPLWEGPASMLRDRGVVQNAAEAVEMFGKMTLAGRAAQPDELVGLAVFLASTESAYINGQCINIDGGFVYD